MTPESGPTRAPAADAEAGREAPASTRDALDRPALAFLHAIPWEGQMPDPDKTDAHTFLAWL